MRVGLVRHFPVREPMPGGWLTAAQLHDWRRRYDSAIADRMNVSIDTEGWVRCYSSDLERAVMTAKVLYPGDAIATSLLREPEVCRFGTGRLMLPCWAWRWVLRIAWLSGHCSQQRARDEFMARVLAVADLIESEFTDVLLFSHAGMMAYLRAELLRRRFVGPKYRIAEYGKLYVFERTSASAHSGSTRVNKMLEPR